MSKESHAFRNGQRVVSLFLVNGQTAPERNKDQAWLFQVAMKISATDGTAIFRKRSITRVRQKLDIDQFYEEEEMAMIFRHEVEFAVGHGVAIHAVALVDDPWHAVSLETVSIPSYDVPQQTAAEPDDSGFRELAGLEVNMKLLANATKESISAYSAH